MIRWTATTEFVFHIGALGQVAYLADPSKQIMGVWLFLALALAPYLVLLLFRHGELSDEAVSRAHLLAALWYLLLTLIVAALAVGGYRPEGWIVFLVFITPGAAISLLLVRERLRDPRPPILPTD